jgi:hypothetical protein
MRRLCCIGNEHSRRSVSFLVIIVGHRLFLIIWVILDHISDGVLDGRLLSFLDFVVRLGLVLCKSFIAHFAYFFVIACLTRLISNVLIMRMVGKDWSRSRGESEGSWIRMRMYQYVKLFA